MSFWDETPTNQPYDPDTPPEEQREDVRDKKGIYLTKKGTYQVYIRMWGKQHFIGTYTTIDEAYNAKAHFIETGIKQKGATIQRKKRPSKIPLEELIKAANSESNFYEDLMEAEQPPMMPEPSSDFLVKPFKFQNNPT